MDLEERAAVKQRRPVNSKKKRMEAERKAEQDRLEKQNASVSIAAAAAAAPAATVVSFPTAAPSVPIVTLEQHQRRDNETELFAYSIERPALRAATEVIISTPPAVSALSFCAAAAAEDGGVAWYNTYLKTLGSVAFQNTPLIRRSVLITFLREPDTSVPFERPCFNLDREPLPHEQRVRCIAHRLSEEQLGAGRGYRLRELLYNDQCVKINRAVAQRTDPMVHLTPVPELCYMCHVWMTTEACLDQRNRMEERKQKDLTVPGASTPPPAGGIPALIFNRFMVDIDKPGEYDRRKMLCSDDVTAMGVWGPFPAWNKRNYVACMVRFPEKSLRGFEETDNLLFRLPRVPLQSGPTSAAPAVLTFRQ
jgi:hypothetical protein